jgi:hypothetical protein
MRDAHLILIAAVEMDRDIHRSSESFGGGSFRPRRLPAYRIVHDSTSALCGSFCLARGQKGELPKDI